MGRTTGRIPKSLTGKIPWGLWGEMLEGRYTGPIVSRARERSPDRMADPRHSLGRQAEDASAAFLERAGLAVVERNVRLQHGELDLVCRDGSTWGIRRGEVPPGALGRRALGGDRVVASRPPRPAG